MGERFRVLLVDERVESRRFPEQFRVDRAPSVEDGLSALETGGFDAAWLAVEPLDAVGLLRRASARARGTPIIVSLAGGAEGIEAEAISAGAAEVVDGEGLDPEAASRLLRRAILRARASTTRGPAGTLRRGEDEFRILVENSSDSITLHDREARYLYASPATRSIIGRAPEDMIGENVYDFIHPDDHAAVRREHDKLRASTEPCRFLFRFLHGDGRWVWLETIARSLPDAETGAIATIQAVTRDASERILARQEIRRLNQQLERRLRRMEALHRNDTVITSGLELREVLDVVVDQAMAQLGADAAEVLIFDGSAGTFEVACARGIPGPEAADHSHRSALAAEVAESGRALHLADLSASEGRDESVAALLRAGFRAYHAAPVVVMGAVKGVLEVFLNALREPEADWVDFLGTLAGQVAIAIEHAGLIERLRKSNLRLSLAYEATIEGWAHVLDLRDHETEGHSRRVTDMTVRLAEIVGVTGPELIHIRRGALLHDIGKMGIPDAILHKAGPLTGSELEVMKRHPSLAREMIWPIEFLRPALEIPYAHHERWDGSGYPLGLSGEQIPLSARIFAAVDIWDALIHERPYREAWPEDRAREYIRGIAGSELDPSVVEVFLKHLGSIVSSVGVTSSRVDRAPDGVARPVASLAAEHPGELGSELAYLKRWKILVAEDDPASADVLARTLRRMGYDVETASDGESAWKALQSGGIRIVLADWSMPGTDGPTLCRRIRGRRGQLYVYFILITARGGSEDRLLGLNSGVDDFLTKPLEPGELAARLEIARRILNMQEGLLERSILAENMHAELQVQNERLAELAIRDPLTGLFNRRHLLDRLNAEMAAAARCGSPISLLMLDVDHFKHYNDDFGHGAGDDVLRSIAGLFRANLRAADLAARYGGEEFVALLPEAGVASATATAERLRSAIALHRWPHRPVTASLGVATILSGPWDADRLIDEADKALYRSKRRGRDRVTHFDQPEDHAWPALPAPRPRRARGHARPN